VSSEVSFDLSGKVMVVTGAGKGIGKSIAQTAAGFGANLALGSRTLSECEEVAQTCRAQGVQAMAWQLDVTNLDSIDRFVADVWDAFGRIDSVAAYRLQGDLGGGGRIGDGVENAALPSQRPVFGQRAPGLPLEPHRHLLGPPAAGRPQVQAVAQPVDRMIRRQRRGS